MVFADSNIHEPWPIDLAVSAPSTALHQPQEIHQLAGGGVNLTTTILALCWTNLREPDSAKRNATQ